MLLETCLKKSAYGMYRADGWIGKSRFRLALGTERKEIAQRRVTLIERGASEGAESAIWTELKDALPRRTFEFFARAIGYQDQPKSADPAKSSWADLCEVFELEMQRLIENKARGANSEEGVLSESTRDRYRQTIRHFTAFLGDHLGGQTAFLDDIKRPTIEMFKVSRQKQIAKLKQSRGGASVALDVVILHRMFAFATSKHMMSHKPINLQNESKPGKNPKNGARPFTAEELVKLRQAAGLVNNGGELRKPTTDLEKRLQEITGGDLFIFLVLRWTGLRISDAINLRWRNIYFDRGVNGEIEILTQKRSKIAVLPLATELRDTLEEIYQKRKPQQDDRVLFSPENGLPFSSRQRPYERMKALGVRAGVPRVTPHCFRDSFACDMLTRGVSIFEVAKMLADTVDTIEKHYAHFVPAARDAVQAKMDHGIGIEERAEMTKQRGKKVVAIGYQLNLHSEERNAISAAR